MLVLALRYVSRFWWGGGEALADPADLSGGVFIAHAPSNLAYTNSPPSGSWCGEYLQSCAIDSCGEQDNRIDAVGMAVWYVLSAWGEPKAWCGAEFGFGDYDEEAFLILEHGACFPNQGLAIPTSGWPGPNEGIALATTDSSWAGNFEVVYWVAGYAYSEEMIPLSADPGSGFGGWAGCEDQEEYAAGGFGGMGLLTEGMYACPGEGEGGGGEEGGEGEGGDAGGDEGTGEDTAGGEIEGGGEAEEEGGTLDSEDPDRLAGGVLLVHHPIGLEYSAGVDYCAYAADSLSFPDCWEDVNPTVPIDSATSVWFVIAAWQEAKEFERIDFGFGSFDEQAYGFLDHGPCFPGEGQEISDAGWPGPLKGTSVATSTTPWQGEFVPIYYFAGYAYSEAEIAIQGRQGEHFARAYNALAEPSDFRPTRCGVLGIGRAGVRACPDQSVIQETLVWFAPDSVALPAATTHGTIEELTCPSEVAAILAQYPVRHVVRTNPAVVKDTVGFATRSGRTAHRTDRTSWFSFVAHDSAQACSLAADLREAQAVFQASEDGIRIHSLIFPSEFGQLGNLELWHLHNDGTEGCAFDVDIDAPEAWNIETGSPDIKLGIIDYPIGGPDFHHPDLRTLWTDCAFPPDPGECHGLQVAGVVGAITNSPGGEGIAAVDWHASIGCFPILTDYTSPLNADSIVAVIGTAVASGCMVLNCSWGVEEPKAENFHVAFIDAYMQDVLTIAAIGEHESGRLYPGGQWDTGMLSVGGVDCEDVPGPNSPLAATIDVAAPSTAIYTLTVGSLPYTYATGTSLAAPIVSGIATLLLAYALPSGPDLSADDVAQLIRLGAVDLGIRGWDLAAGWGRANAFNSLRILHQNGGPYIFRQLSQAADTTLAYEQMGLVECDFIGVPYGEEDEYTGRLTVTQFVATMEVGLGGGLFTSAPPIVWGRGMDMHGYGLDSPQTTELSPIPKLWGYGYCDTIGTAGEDSAVLRTYLYHHMVAGWFPCAPEEVVWHFGVYSAEDQSSAVEDGFQEGREPPRPTLQVEGLQRGGALFLVRLPSPSALTVCVYDLQGRLVRQVADEPGPAGAQELVWDGRNEKGMPVGSGVYWVQVQTSWGIMTKRFVMVR